MLEEAIETWKLKVLAVPYFSIEEEEIELLPKGFNIKPNSLYQQHPLKSKKNTYLPIKSYYQMIFKERELEFINIMVQLGATEITIVEVSNSNRKSSNEESEAFSTSVSLKGLHLLSKGFSLSQDFKSSLKEFKKENKERILVKEYEGKPWSSNLEIDTSNCTWLEYDQDWQRIVEDRIKHKQTYVLTLISSDIYDMASNADGSNIDLTMQGDVGKVSGEISAKRSMKENYENFSNSFEKHIVEVCFKKENYQTQRSRIHI